MPINIEMPKLSDTMTEGTIAKWLKAEGDDVEVGDIIAEVETDKATMEVEAFEDGVFAKILIPEGGKAPVGAVIAVIAEEGENPSEITVAEASSAAETEEPTESVSKVEPGTSGAEEVSDADEVDVTTIDGVRIKASPLARKIAESKGLNLATINGSGPGGRIVKVDVEKAKRVPAAPVATSVGAIQGIPAMAPGADDTVIPLTGMRKIIADRLVTSKVTIPHFYLHVECDVEPLFELRKQVNEKAADLLGNKFSVNDFVVGAVVKALNQNPAVNAQFAGDSIVEYKNVGLSVAIAVDNGLVTPVIKEAQNKSLLEISQSIKDMAGRARDNKLKPAEFDGGTITVSNLGAWGVEAFDAIVNPPQAAIISVGGAIKKPVVKGDAIVPGMRMNIGLSCDHRVVDGAVAADFLNAVKSFIENPSLILL